MGDEEGGENFDFGGDGGGETSVADPEPGCGQKLQTAICSCCLGLFLFPFSLWLLGWNERNFVCSQKQIIYAEDNALEWPCVRTTELGENQLYHLSCPFDPTSYSDFTASRFNPAATDPSLQTLLLSLQFSGLGGKQTAQVYTCVETSHSRQEGTGNNRRTITSYTYAPAWSTNPTAFHQTPLTGVNLQSALTSCSGVPQNWQGAPPAFPIGINEGINTRHADSVTAATVALPENWIEQIPINTVVTQSDLISPITAAPAIAGGWRIDGVSATVTTCANLNAPIWGCAKLTYEKSSATQASIIANVGAGALAGPEITPSSWACAEDEYYAFYPSTAAMTLEQIITAEHSSNSAQAWMIRIAGLLLAWAAVFCLFSPVTFAADVFGDCLAFIPCVGSMLEDIVEGVVNAVVCCISCSIGCSSGLLVIAIVMLVMRPLWGGLLLLAACCLIGGSFAVASQAPRKQRQGEEETELPLMDES